MPTNVAILLIVIEAIVIFILIMFVLGGRMLEKDHDQVSEEKK